MVPNTASPKEAAPAAREPRKCVLAVASGGGHWVQLTRLLPALEGCKLMVATVQPESAAQVAAARAFHIPDANRWNKLGLLRLALRMAWVVLRARPQVVLSTGAAPGYFALLFGKLLGARTIWVDSIANVERLSLSGQKVRRCADLWLTQWEHLARPGGPEYRGSVL